MKKNVLVLVVLLLIPAVAFCFDLSLGFKLAPNLGFVSGEDWVDMLEGYYPGVNEPALRIGISAGVFFTIGLVDFLAIQPEVLISSERGGYSFLNLDGTLSSTFIKIPIFLKPRVNVGPGQLYLLVGPEIAFILGNLTLTEKIGPVELEADLEPDRTILFGISGGLGYDSPLGPGRISIEGRYGRTWSQPFIDFEIGGYLIDKTFQNTFFIFIGYGLTLL